jgi:hypothetical protein
MLGNVCDSNAEREDEVTEDDKRKQDNDSDATERGEPDQAPVDGPAPGGEGQEDQGELGSTSQDKPGGR